LVEERRKRKDFFETFLRKKQEERFFGDVLKKKEARGKIFWDVFKKQEERPIYVNADAPAGVKCL